MRLRGTRQLCFGIDSMKFRCWGVRTRLYITHNSCKDKCLYRGCDSLKPGFRLSSPHTLNHFSYPSFIYDCMHDGVRSTQICKPCAPLKLLSDSHQIIPTSSLLISSYEVSEKANSSKEIYTIMPKKPRRS